ncbi:hypothetical protein GCM10027446_17570 [Angustibacter peucedani]
MVVGSVLGVLAVAAALLVVWQVAAEKAADNANGSVPVTSTKQLAGSWTSVNDVRAPAPVVPGTVVRLTFDGEQLRVETGCNQLTGTAHVTDSTLEVEGLGGTEMGCDAPRTAQEKWVGEMLLAGPRLELSGPYLSLLWGDHWLGLTSQPDGGGGATM